MDMRSLSHTSSGVAHVHIHNQPLNINSCQDAPLPPLLQERRSGPLYHKVTSYMEHFPKPRVSGDVIYSKAPPHWSTHLLNNLAQKVRDPRSLRLVSAPPLSEIQDQYRGPPAPCQTLELHYKPLKALHRQLSKSVDLLPKHPALSTAQSDYRRFSRSELAPLSSSDAPPTRGLFTQSATLPRLPPHQAPPSASSQLHLHHLPVPVPHGSRSSVYMDSFGLPSHPPKYSAPPPADTIHTEESGRSLLQHILDVPEMYGTENQTYGKGRMMLM